MALLSAAVLKALKVTATSARYFLLFDFSKRNEFYHPLQDIDECAVGSDNCDTKSSYCENIIGSFTCNCKDGFKNEDSEECINIDECLENTPCSANADCIDSEGSFECHCKSGFAGNGLTCADKEECTEDAVICFENSSCANTIGGFM